MLCRDGHALRKGLQGQKRISRRSEEAIAAVCKAAHSEPEGMGIGFIRIEPGGEATLDKWVGSLKE
jgi:hypothetical protein